MRTIFVSKEFILNRYKLLKISNNSEFIFFKYYWLLQQSKNFKNHNFVSFSPIIEELKRQLKERKKERKRERERERENERTRERRNCN